MKRIGLAASKMAQGNVWLYNLAVVFIACLFSLFAFLVCGFSIAATIFVLSVLAQWFIPIKDPRVWVDILRTCLTFLGVILGVMTFIAILKNVKLRIKL